MPFDQQIEDLVRRRQDAAERGKVARSRGQVILAERFEWLVREWDTLLAQYGVKLDSADASGSV
jgi:hypothetical protein